MKRTIYAMMAALLTMLVVAQAALAQDTTMMMEESTMMGGQMGSTMMDKTMMEDSMVGGQMGDLPESGGPAVLLPVAALLLGSGILTYAVVRRR